MGQKISEVYNTQIMLSIKHNILTVLASLMQQHTQQLVSYLHL